MMFPFEFGLLALYSAKIFFAIFDVRQGAKTLAPQRPPLKSLPSHLLDDKDESLFFLWRRWTSFGDEPLLTVPLRTLARFINSLGWALN